MKTRKYSNSPLIEFVCAFHFEIDPNLEESIPITIYQEVKDQFPKIKNKNFPNVNVDPSNPRDLTINTLTQFSNNEESLLLQVGQNLLTINNVKNYPTWENFKPIILNNYAIYNRLYKPKSLLRIGVRAINKIIIPTSEIQDLSTFFTIVPNRPLNLDAAVTNFNNQLELFYNQDRLMIRASNANPESIDNSIFMLDFDYYSTNKIKNDLDLLNNWLDNAHFILNQCFEGSITENLRKKFDQ